MPFATTPPPAGGPKNNPRQPSRGTKTQLTHLVRVFFRVESPQLPLKAGVNPHRLPSQPSQRAIPQGFRGEGPQDCLHSVLPHPWATG